MPEPDSASSGGLGGAALLNSASAWLSGQQAAQVVFGQGGWQFDYWERPVGGKTLLVFMPSALRRDKRRLPAFHRWSWSAQLPEFDVLCVSDPTLRLDARLLGGWMQGRGKDWILRRVLAHVGDLVGRRGHDTVVFCGSSLGGFCALQAAVLASADLNWRTRVLAYAENPQVVMPLYLFKNHRDLLAEVCYGVSCIEEVPRPFLERLDLVRLIEGRGRAPLGHVVTKASDTHHQDLHLAHLRACTLVQQAPGLILESIPAADDASGHTPLEFAPFRQRLQGLLDRAR